MSVSVGTMNKPVVPKAPFSFRRHIVPPLLGISMMAVTLGALNGQWIIAQAQYKFATYSNPNTAAAVSAAVPNANAQPEVIIPKIQVNAPIVTNVGSYKEADVHKGLENGVVHYWQTADPGQNGNIVLFGHSSGQVWAPGHYKFVFTLLDKLSKNDLIMIDFKGTRYMYRVTDTKIVPPTDFSVVQPTDYPQLTLITCTPVGTSKNRLIVHAKQVTPKPETNKPMPQATEPIGGAGLPSN
jgi:sortase A